MERQGLPNSISYKKRRTTFALLAVLLISACSNTPESKPISPPTTVIEIRQNAKGMYDVTGESLFFRLYSDGSAEFEWFDRPNAEGIYKASEVSRTAKINLPEGKFEEFRQVIGNPNFAALSDKYTRECCCTDASTTYEVHSWVDGKERLTVLENYCDLGEVTSSKSNGGKNVPADLATLFKLAQQTRSKYVIEKNVK